jgi:hypothetical protein
MLTPDPIVAIGYDFDVRAARSIFSNALNLRWRIPREKLAVVTARHLARARRVPSRTVNVLAVFTPNDGSSPVGLPFVPPLAAFEYGGV